MSTQPTLATLSAEAAREIVEYGQTVGAFDHSLQAGHSLAAIIARHLAPMEVELAEARGLLERCSLMFESRCDVRFDSIIAGAIRAHLAKAGGTAAAASGPANTVVSDDAKRVCCDP